MLDAIKKKDDNNLIDLTLFNEVIRVDCDNYNNNGEWSSKYKEKAETRSRRNLSKTFNQEGDGGRVRHSVLEAFDPLLESTYAKIALNEQEIESGELMSWYFVRYILEKNLKKWELLWNIFFHQIFYYSLGMLFHSKIFQ